jgi:TnpA family transposase
MQNSTTISEDALALDWTLSAYDKHWLFANCKGTGNLLRSAMQLCCLRKSGAFIRDNTLVPIQAKSYIAKQLECNYDLLLLQPDQSSKEYYSRDKVREYLGFQLFDTAAQAKLTNWGKQQIKKEFPSQEILLKRAQDFLRVEKIVLPTPAQLGRKIATIRSTIQNQAYTQIADKLPEHLQQQLDQLLIAAEDDTVTTIQAFKVSPPQPCINAFDHYFKCLDKLQQLKVDQIDLSDIHPELVQSLYQLANTYNAWDLKRLPKPKRYALLICLLSEAYKTVLDHLVELNDKMIANKEREARNQFLKKIKMQRKDVKKSEKIIITAMESLLKHPDPKNITLAKLLPKNRKRKLQKAINNCKLFHDYEDSGSLKELSTRYGYLRKYAPRFFNLDFKVASGSEKLLEAINILRKLDDGQLQSLPQDVPCYFVPKNWQNDLYHNDKSICRRTWELALYSEVKQALKTGDLYLSHSRHHYNFWETIDNTEKAINLKLLPNQADKAIAGLKQELDKNIQLAKQHINTGSYAYIDEKCRLKLHRDQALDIPASTNQLRQQIESRLPVIRIEKLLAEVEVATNFSKCFTPLPGFAPKASVPLPILNATLIAHATNIGVYGMAHSAEGVNLPELRDASRWLIYPDSLKSGNTCLINAHYQHPLSKVYGDGSRSSSDGQRYGIQCSSLLASYYPRYFGYYDLAFSLYTHISDVGSVFSTQAISCGPREALYVLGGLLSNDSQLNPNLHCTDTHGFTHHVFALCYLLGFSFQPHLKDLADQKLYKIDPQADYGQLNCLFSSTIDLELIQEQWEQLIKIASAIKNRTIAPHIILERLINRVAIDRVAKALMELGKLIKTIFILRYLSDVELRHAVRLQLNRGECRHYLAQHIFFANQGIFKTSDYEEIMNKASCLGFVSNAVLYWNTVHIGKIVDILNANGYRVDNTDLARISPFMFKHLMTHGIYQF